jgi:hypothetical protein
VPLYQHTLEIEIVLEQAAWVVFLEIKQNIIPFFNVVKPFFKTKLENLDLNRFGLCSGHLSPQTARQIINFFDWPITLQNTSLRSPEAGVWGRLSLRPPPNFHLYKQNTLKNEKCAKTIQIFSDSLLSPTPQPPTPLQYWFTSDGLGNPKRLVHN